MYFDTWLIAPATSKTAIWGIWSAIWYLDKGGIKLSMVGLRARVYLSKRPREVKVDLHALQVTMIIFAQTTDGCCPDENESQPSENTNVNCITIYGQRACLRTMKCVIIKVLKLNAIELERRFDIYENVSSVVLSDLAYTLVQMRGWKYVT